MFSKNFLRRTVSAVFIVSIMFFSAVSYAEIYTGTSEYIMSEGENEVVAKERAKADAISDACKKAESYVKSFALSKNFDLADDVIGTITSKILKLTEVPQFNIDGKTIRVTVQAQVYDSDINRWLNKDSQQVAVMVAQNNSLCNSIKEHARRIAKLKQQLADNPQDKDVIAQKFNDEDKIFLSDQKVDEAWKFYDEGDFNKAVSLHSEAIEINPENPLAYYGRGTAYSELNQNELAIKDLSKSIELDPTDSYTYYNRGSVYYDLEQYELAIKDYDKAIELDPEDYDSYNNRGNAYYFLEQYEQAIKDFDKAIKLKPNDSEAYNNRGNAYYGLKKYAQAIKDFDKALELKPNDSEVYNNRANAYSDSKKYEQAIQDYNKAIELDPNYADAYYNRGLTYQEMGEEAKAQADFAKAKELGCED